jgi:glutathione S-transferase
MILVIGNKRLSSWSLRPWLVATHFEVPFQEKLIFLDQPTTTKEIMEFSPSGKVPALVDEGQTIWDSLAICEYLSDKFPNKNMWPSDPLKRGWARSVSAEMHSGFQTMRQLMSHDLQKQHKTFVSDAALVDISRVKEIWTECLKKSGGPFLFGSFSIADAMYAPVVNRFITYAVPIDQAAESEISKYMKSIRELPAHRAWIQEGLKETIETPFHP